MKKKVLSMLMAAMLVLVMLPISISADDGPVCPVSEGWVVISKRESYVVNRTVTLKNSTSLSQTMSAEGQRSVYAEASSGVSLSLFESVFGVSAETSSGTSYTTTESASPLVPPHTTYYVDFGYRYVSGTIQRLRVNSDCSKTYIGSQYSAEYTTGPYVEIRE